LLIFEKKKGPFPSKMMKETLEKYENEIKDSIPLARIGNANDMAGIIVYLSSIASAYVTGAIIPIDGGALVKSSM
jgi:NAD(P)-dependent dehydrogenase (short-subunit alcohol dehydrogenase family)